MKKSRIFLLATISVIFIFANSAQAARLMPRDGLENMRNSIRSWIAHTVNNGLFSDQDSFFCCDINNEMHSFNPLKTIRDVIPSYGETYSWQDRCMVADLCIPESPLLQECETHNGDTPVPEPSTSFLLGSGLLAIALLRKRFIR